MVTCILYAFAGHAPDNNIIYIFSVVAQNDKHGVDLGEISLL